MVLEEIEVLYSQHEEVQRGANHGDADDRSDDGESSSRGRPGSAAAAAATAAFVFLFCRRGNDGVRFVG